MSSRTCSIISRRLSRTSTEERSNARRIILLKTGPKRRKMRRCTKGTFGSNAPPCSQTPLCVHVTCQDIEVAPALDQVSQLIELLVPDPGLLITREERSGLFTKLRILNRRDIHSTQICLGAGACWIQEKMTARALKYIQ